MKDQNSEKDMPDGGSSGPRYLPTGTGLPGSQQRLLDAVLALGKPTVVVLISGEGIAVDTLAAHASDGANDTAILYHAYPGGTGGTAIAESVLGRTYRPLTR